jgi:predicted house-cleaning noncanonical NTP pyrophosphatase (MazG superfamily)
MKKRTKKPAKKKKTSRKKQSELQARVQSIKEKLPKLVRDRVPDHIVKDDLVPVFHFASDGEDIRLLQQKLREEIEEFMAPTDFQEFMKGDYSELADVLDVIDCLIRAGTGPAGHIGSQEVAICRQEKAVMKGKFEKQIVLENIVDRRELK